MGKVIVFSRKIEFNFWLERFIVYLCTALKEGAIAQLVEQRTENPCVPSSILGGTTKG
jgi:hypothetical protein